MASAKSHIMGRQALAEAWVKVTGKEASLAELQLAGAHSDLESGYGQASYTNQLTGEKAVLNNWGAVQAGKPPCGPGGFEATDTHVDGSKYQSCYKRYATPAEGAAHVVEHLTIKRPTAWELMKKGDIDAWTKQLFAYKLDANGNPTKELNKDPVSGAYGYYEQKPESRAKGIESRVNEIAAALGEPVAAKRGGPVNDSPPNGGSGAIARYRRPAAIALLVAALAAILKKVLF